MSEARALVDSGRLDEAAGQCRAYPAMRLYRQPMRGDWDSVIAAVRRDLDDPQ